MLKTTIIGILGAFVFVMSAQALCPPWPNCLTNGQPADASQVMANFNAAAPLASPSFTGNVGIGTTSATNFLTVGNNSSSLYGMASTNSFVNVAGWSGLYELWTTGIPGRTNWGLAREYANGGDIGFLRSSAADGTPDTTVLYMTGTGNVGIGTTSPGYSLDIGAATGTPIIRLNSGSGTANGSALFLDNSGSVNTAIGNFSLIYGGYYNSALTLYTSGADVLIPNGDVGIGTLTPYSTLHVRSGGNENLLIRAGGSGGMSLGSVNDANSVFQPIEIDGSTIALMVGNVGIGTSSPAEALDTGSGVVRANGFRGRAGLGGATSNTFNINWTGSGAQLWIDATNVGTISTVSDRRLKQQIEPMADNGLSRLMKLRPVTFHWRDNGMFHDDKVLHQGFIADEVQDVIPSAVNNKKNEVDAKGHPVYQSLVPTEIVPVLTKAVQEQQAEIESLKNALDAKEAEIKALKSEQQAQIDDMKAKIAKILITKVASIK